MSQQTVLRQWNEEIRKRMPHLSKPQSKALAAFSVGIAKEEGCGLNAADKKLSFAENPAAVERGYSAVGRDWDVLASQGEGVQEVGLDRALGGALVGLRPRGAAASGGELPGVGWQGVWSSHADRADV